MKNLIKFSQFINESMKLSGRFDEEETETLGFLMHDKAHVLGEEHRNLNSLYIRRIYFQKV